MLRVRVLLAVGLLMFPGFAGAWSLPRVGELVPLENPPAVTLLDPSGWRAHGSVEPDTAYDSATWMWRTPPPTSGPGRVYFNAIEHAAGSGVNPNNAVTGSRLSAGGAQWWYAYLGAWRDCNNDGYIGYSETGLLEYHAQLLLDSSVCPAGSDHNRGGWVRELRWIGPLDSVGDQDLDGNVWDDVAERAPGAVHDAEARVWADVGAPGTVDATCPLAPPRGASASTGGLVSYTDCFLNRRAAWYTGFADRDVFGPLVGPVGLALDDAEDPSQSQSLLNQDSPYSLWGNPHQGAGSGADAGGLLEDGHAEGGADPSPVWTTWDCSQFLGVTIGSVRVGTPMPSPRFDAFRFDASRPGSVYDAFNHSVSQADCQEGGHEGYAFVSTVEGGAFEARSRRASDVTLRFQGYPAPAVLGAPPDAGSQSAHAALGIGWIAPKPSLTDVKLVDRHAQPTSAQYVTFYARVGPSVPSAGFLTPGGVGVYGAQACGGATQGTYNGWSCDANAWHKDAHGASTAPRQEYGPQNVPAGQARTRPYGASRDIAARPGDLYQLRDVDCTDGELVRDTPFYLGPQYVTETPDCANAPGALHKTWDVVPELDEDFNGLGDDFQRRHKLTQQQIQDALERGTDFDLDAAGLLTEFKWDTKPLPGGHDTDADGWKDGAEIAYWNVGQDPAINLRGGVAYRDPDSYRDVDQDGLANQHDPDSDNDGLPDGDEIQLGTYPEARDSDCPSTGFCRAPQDTTYRPEREDWPGDGIPDAEEVQYWNDLYAATGHPQARPTGDCDGDGIPNLRDADSDNDQFLDGEERLFGSDPCRADEDGDGLPDGEEEVWLTDPRNPDSDADGMPDGWEARHAPATTPSVSDAELDTDMDGLSNIDEYHGDSDPRLADTDHDTLNDHQEVVVHRTNPRWWDTDHDGMHDAWEIQYQLDPRDPADADLDPDQDGPDFEGDGIADEPWTNFAEYQYPLYGNYDDATLGPRATATNPREPDTNGDGLNDGQASWGVPTDDTDRDGLLNIRESQMGTDYGNPDSDGDGLCDGGRAEECRFMGVSGGPGEVIDFRSSPRRADTDEDGISDGDEAVTYGATASGSVPDHDGDGLNALQDADSDDDGLRDGEELGLGTSPILTDTDTDGLTDYEEIYVYVWSDHTPDPTLRDTDGDNLLDGEEILVHFSHPNLPDTDGDGLQDDKEIAIGTSPISSDTDSDRMPDKWEVDYMLDPLVNDADEDADHDAIILGLTNYQEYLLGTNPRDPDSERGIVNPLTGEEGDGINDYIEYMLGLDPLADDRELDSDGDGLPNLAEYLFGTKPSLADTDRDGLRDGWEAGIDTWQGTTDPLTLLQLQGGLGRTDPNDYDTDDDGLEDKAELDYWNTVGAAAWMTDYDGDGALLPQSLSHNLRDRDADGDGLDDGQEVTIFKTQPFQPDSDGDGDSDYDEIMAYATDPRDPTSNRTSVGAPPAGLDSDGDGLPDEAERNVYRTDPGRKDTDGDLIEDGIERIAWGDDWNVNYDGDGITNNLLDADSDNDGLSDGVEFASAGLDSRQFYITSPRHRDTDDDGLADGEEETNGVAGEAAARSRTHVGLPPAPNQAQALSAGWSGDDEFGRYALGAFGIKLYDVSEGAPRSGTPTSGAQANGHSRNKDTDGDKVTDGAEKARDTAINVVDTDGDGIPDGQEPAGDADGDGLDNAKDTDSDGDLLLDSLEWDEGRQNNPTKEASAVKLDAYDGDSDDDGVCDKSEYDNPALSSATNPDTDRDGLPDGLELQVRDPGCIITTAHSATGASVSTSWTNRSLPLGSIPGRMTFHPYGGADEPFVPQKGKLPVQASDFDDDGIPDGIEEINPNGVWEKGLGETNWIEKDTDGDGVDDGRETRIFGPILLDDFVARYQRAGLSPTSAIIYDPTNPWETNANNRDTDIDGVADGKDLAPRDNAVIEIAFKTFQQIFKIDPCCGAGQWAPDLLIELTVGTAAGDITFRTPSAIPNVYAKEETDLANYITASTLTALPPSSVVGSANNIRHDPIQNGVVTIDITDDVSNLTSAGDNLGQVVISLELRDQDFSEDDVLDIDPRNGVRKFERAYHVVRDLGTEAIKIDAEGASDSSHMNLHEDDARIKIDIISNLLTVFFDTAKTVKATGFAPKPPGGQCFGYGGC